MQIRMLNMARRFGLPLAAALLTAGAFLVAACGSTNEGTPPPVADFVTDTAAPAVGEVTMQPGAANGTMIDLQVRVQGFVAGILAANFDLLFQTFRCQDNQTGQGTQNTCFTDNDCLAGESCKQSGNLVARFVTATISPSLLDCGLPGTLLPLVTASGSDTERLIFGLSRLNFQACSSETPCPNGDTDCLGTFELCGAAGKCVKPASNCIDNPSLCSGTEVCVEQACDAVGAAVLLTLTFEILDRGSIRVEFADTPGGTPPTLQDLNLNPISVVSFPAGRGGILQGL